MLKSAARRLPDEAVQRGRVPVFVCANYRSGSTLTAIAAGLAWVFFFAWAGPTIAQSFRSHWRQQKSYASYWQNGQWRDVENGIEEESVHKVTKASAERAMKKSTPAGVQRREHWYSRKREAPRTRRKEGRKSASKHRKRRHSGKREERDEKDRRHKYRRHY